MPKRSDTDKSLPPFDLKAAREARGLTQAEAAELLHASQPSIARWEGEGNLPQIYRSYWELYWKHHQQPKQKTKAKAKAKSAKSVNVSH